MTLTLAKIKSKYPTSKEGKVIELSVEGRAAVKLLIRTREKKAELEATEEAAKAIILSEMKDAEQGDAGTHTVWAKSRETNRFDTTAFKDQHETLYEEFITVSVSRPIEVKVKADA
jgi:predicted phage-related endonuclease